MSTTPFMDLQLPDPTITPGPLWATEINTALETVDSHDHTSGKGTQITPAAMLINSDLAFNAFAATLLKLIGLISQGSTLSGTNFIQNVGGNLYWNNGAGTPVQITAGSAVVSPGSGALTVNVITSYPYTVSFGDSQRVLIIDTSAARTINLPAATTAMFFMIKDGLGGAQGQPISIVPNGTDAVDGANSAYVLDSAWESVGLISDGISQWYVV